MAKRKIVLFGIDLQQDFMDTDEAALRVPGATDDAKRTAKLIQRMGGDIDDIRSTLDTHQQFAIFHPMFWVDKKGNHPNPFAVITQGDVEKGIWRTTIPTMQSIGLEYVTQLHTNGRYELRIWPYHCLVGTPGHNVEPSILSAYNNWEMKYKARVGYIMKGHNMYTEHYSAVQADVPNDDPTTGMNTDLIMALQDFDEVWVVGQAGSHCVANTGRDVAREFGSDSVKKLVFLEDCMSPVQQCEQLQIDFLNDMRKLGARITTSSQLLS